MEKRENNHIETESEADAKKNKIRSSDLKAHAKPMDSTQVLQGEEADQTLNEAFGQESKLDTALKISLGLGSDDEMASTEEAKPVSRLKSVLNFLLTLAICIVLALLFTRFVMQRNTVVGQSMEPTLIASDELFVEKLSHIWNDYDRTELVTARTDGQTDDGKPVVIIKRLIGLPGDKITIEEGEVYINGVELEEPYLSDDVKTNAPTNSSFEVTLGEDEYFLMGDNRADSYDSRHFGPVNEEDLVGRVWIRFYPFDRFGKP
ncbi:MAG: signal peptidase I [Eubacteriales bacterium]|nr:signal peptidase I [Eubacteriales bacterium]MDD4541190.1 signal peptidase I [Eubacteriales bacterium]